MSRPEGRFVTIFGADGSGKSSVLEALARRGRPPFHRVRVLHFRPRLGSSTGKGIPVTEPHAQAPRGPWASSLKLFYYLIDFQLGYLFKLRRELRRGNTIVFDRYYHDILVDPRRYRYGGPRRLARLVGRLVPKPDTSILLDAPASVLRERKQEIALEDLRRGRDAYLAMVSALPNGHVVDASRPLREVVERVEELVRTARSAPSTAGMHGPGAGAASGTPEQRYASFPLGLGHIAVPTSSRRDALASVALYAPCRPLTLRLHQLAWMWIGWFGPRALPGRARPWLPPMPTEVWQEIRERWRSEVGPFETLAIARRPKSWESRLAFLLLRQGSPVAFVKLQLGRETALAHEREALCAVDAFAPRSFSAPKPLAFGEVGEWSFLATAPFPPELHRVPEQPPLAAIAEEIQLALTGLPRPSGSPAHWRPMHGDLTPWNVRWFERRGLVIFDWEEAGWGPPGADEVLYRATVAALGGGTAAWDGRREAVSYWQERLRIRPTPGRRESRLTRSLREALASMAAPHPATDSS